MRKIYLFICVTVFTLIGKAQQDPQYNLYQFNPLIINPAYAGAKDGLSAVASNRQQWVGFDGAPKTTCLSLHGPVLKKNLGLGLTVVNDVLGARNVTSFYANVAYILKLNRKLKLSFGLNAGYDRYQFNFNKISFDAIEVPSQFTQNQTKGALDINTGLYLRSQKFFVGLSSTHINSPSIYDYQPPANAVPGSKDFTYHLSTHLFLTAGYSFKLSENAIFAPTILAKEVNGVTGLDINLNFFIYKKLWLGAFYRAGYGPGALLQYYVTNQFRVAYSYDTGISDARKLGGSHEIMIGFDFGSTKSKMMNPRFL
jgi:type IX secretion system PorP/SprF family membrane protein